MNVLLRRLGSAFVAIALALGAGHAPASAGGPDPKCVEAVKRLTLLKAQTKTLDFVKLPSALETHAKLGPLELRKSYYDRVIVRSEDHLFFDSAFSMLSQIEPMPGTISGVDVRFGVTLRDADDAELGSIYLDGSGIYGLIDQVPCVINHAFVEAVARAIGILGG